MPAHSHDKLLKVADSFDVMLGYWDRDEVCRFANKAYETWFGKTREQMLGISMEEFFGPSRYAQNLPFIRAALDGHGRVQGLGKQRFPDRAELAGLGQRGPVRAIERFEQVRAERAELPDGDAGSTKRGGRIRQRRGHLGRSGSLRPDHRAEGAQGGRDRRLILQHGQRGGLRPRHRLRGGDRADVQRQFDPGSDSRGVERGG